MSEKTVSSHADTLPQSERILLNTLSKLAQPQARATARCQEHSMRASTLQSSNVIGSSARAGSASAMR